MRFDLVGQQFERLLVVELVGRTPARKLIWLCRCECGREVRVTAGNLRSGAVKSCGCLRGDRIREVVGTHLQTGGKLWNSWRAMMARCYNKRDNSYRYYGGRGITVCAPWHKFEAFARDVGPRPLGKTIDRIDPNQGYRPGNVRWATPAEQVHNRRSGPVDPEAAIHVGQPTAPASTNGQQPEASEAADPYPTECVDRLRHAAREILTATGEFTDNGYVVPTYAMEQLRDALLPRAGWLRRPHELAARDSAPASTGVQPRPPYRCMGCGEAMGSVAKPCSKCGGSPRPTEFYAEHFPGAR